MNKIMDENRIDFHVDAVELDTNRLGGLDIYFVHVVGDEQSTFGYPEGFNNAAFIWRDHIVVFERPPIAKM
ncbi:MAG: hypothetical protein P4L69_10995 [Desulfosporosinus sp.]|nr:hypothetical protein [Desulfosporosinus sp.]